MVDTNSKIEIITIDDLPPSQQELAEIIGLDKYLELVKYVNGDSIYLPKYDSLFEGAERVLRDKEIIEKFDGYNYEELAKAYDLTRRRIYDIIPRRVKEAKRNGPIAGQMSIEDIESL